MIDQKKYAVCLNMIDQLSKVGSWCGETHIQKTTYIMQTLSDMTDRDTVWDFVLYKHGPYSFALHDAIDELLGVDLIAFKFKPPFGPQIRLSPRGEKLLGRFALEEEVVANISKAAKLLADKGVRQLEGIGTSLLLSRRPEFEDDDTLIAERLNKIKPHISPEEAREAVQEFRTLAENFSRE